MKLNMKGWKLVVTDTLMLVPAVWFWISVIMFVGLGTDYWFDAVFAQLGRTTLGNWLLIMLVIGLPGLAVAVNAVSYVTSKKSWQKWVTIVAGILVLLGFLAVLKKS